MQGVLLVVRGHELYSLVLHPLSPYINYSGNVQFCYERLPRLTVLGGRFDDPNFNNRKVASGKIVTE